ncbi:MAG: hypothetical protein DRJ10_05265 [Bacteroidetes bacterium]|nr:MAG: hypothetical protein DRJ10_05265 [Bacteroidota bacterium]RLD83113.1 MAG: hypothetical protein DRJ07_07285 [Bacteroidota bacterium]
MTYNPKIHHRRSIRLKGYDYSQKGLYFITICVKNRTCLFGNITNGKMNLNDAGKMIKNQWLVLPERFNKKLWQRNYWEHIIRNDAEYHRISNYIIENPENWSTDKFNPDNPE